MSELGDLLELLHGAGSRWQTVRVTVRQWHDSELTGAAMERQAERQRRLGSTVVVSSRGSGPSVWESVTRTWIDRRRDRSRVETDGPHGQVLTVRVADRWWTYTPGSGAVSNEAEPEVTTGSSGEVDPLLDPSGVLAAFDFAITGTVVVVDRTALGAVATPRPDDPRRGLGGYLALGADDVLLAVDRERGVLLRTEARLDGRPFAIHEVTEIAFDEELDDDLFRFVSPDGSPVRSPRETFSRPEEVSVEEAARRASFTVLAPSRIPDGWTVETSYMPPSDRPRRADSVTLTLRDNQSRETRLRINQGREPLPDQLDWEAVERDGRRVLVFRNDAKVEVGGTHARLSGNVDRDTLVAIAASLRPAPTELPPLRES